MSLLFFVEAAKALALVAGVAVAATVLIFFALLIARTGFARSVNGGCLLGIVPLLAPAVFVALAAGFGRPQQALYRDGTATTGRVVTNREESSDGTSYTAVIEYTDSSGRTVQFEDINSYNPPRYAIGEAVDVVYQRDAPDGALIRNPVWWVVPASFLFAGAVSWLAIFALLARRFRQRALTIMDVIDEAAV